VLSGRDTNAVNKTVSGLLKLLYPGSGTPVPDEDLEWAVRIALEVRAAGQGTAEAHWRG
jgi:ATP-dependent Lon protease